MTIKVMRAANYDPAKFKGPVWAQPKIDGARGCHTSGSFTARTLKKFKNKYTTALYSQSEYAGFDGEIAAEHDRHPDLCRLTTSALNTIEGQPFTLWHVFDYVTEDTRRLPYFERYRIMCERVKLMQAQGKCGYLRIVPYVVCNNLEELMAVHQKYMDMGYEGTCFYGPNVTHKEGKSSPTHNGVLRIKDFIDSEAKVLSIEEGDTNLNEAQINELGNTYRTSHKENKIPNGMVGCLICEQLKDEYDLARGKQLVIKKGDIIRVSPGKMTHDERVYYFNNPDKIVGQTIKHKFFPKGIKDKPRFSNYQMIRPEEDVM